MLNNIKKTTLFHEYYEEWIQVYKEGAIRDVTMKKIRIDAILGSSAVTGIASWRTEPNYLSKAAQ